VPPTCALQMQRHQQVLAPKFARCQEFLEDQALAIDDRVVRQTRRRLLPSASMCARAARGAPSRWLRKQKKDTRRIAVTERARRSLMKRPGGQKHTP